MCSNSAFGAQKIKGSELYGLLAIQATAAFAFSLVTGLVLRLKQKINSHAHKSFD